MVATWKISSMQGGKMIKKIFLTAFGIFGCILCSSLVVYAEEVQEEATPAKSVKYSQNFITHLVSCKQYREEVPAEMSDNVITPTFVVEGWKNGKCVYVNYPKEAPENKYVCRFTKEQLKEISDVSKKDQTIPEVYKYGGMTYTADPLSVLFTTYMNDSNVCTAPPPPPAPNPIPEPQESAEPAQKS